MKPKILSFCIGLFALHLASCKDASQNDAISANIITSSQAIQYIGLTKTVEGKVVSAKYSSESKNAPTFLNLDKKYPNHEFTVVIWKADRAKFAQPPEEAFIGKTIRVTGEIKTYKNRAQITVKKPSQIEVD